MGGGLPPPCGGQAESGPYKSNAQAPHAEQPACGAPGTLECGSWAAALEAVDRPQREKRELGLPNSK
jgi:hypothetical protein